MAHRHKMHRAAGGRTSFVNSKVTAEAGSTKDSFKRGGKIDVEAHGKKAKARADKFARGGTTRSPFSSAAKGTDMGRTSKTRDKAQPRARGGRCASAKGGKVDDKEDD